LEPPASAGKQSQRSKKSGEEPGAGVASEYSYYTESYYDGDEASGVN